VTLSGYRLRLFALVNFVSLMLLLGANTGARGQTVYDAEAYRQLADASAHQNLPPGTRITLQNWTNYRRFLPVGFQVAYSGHYPIKIGAEPHYVIEVTPTRHFTMPRKFLDDTEKFQNQTQLVPGPGGGYTLSPLPVDTAGLVFGAEPGEPNRGYKVMYNWWLAYWPRISHFYDEIASVDRYRNVGRQTVDFAFYRLSHLSEPGFPPALPYARGYLNSTRLVIIAPENSKYNTTLQMWPANPAKLPDFYTFLPTQRRSLRLSTAATCKPLPGSDYVQDDLGFQLSHFKVTYLGLKRLLTRIPDPAKGRDPASYEPTGSFPGWPKAGTGTWEMRDLHVIDLQPLPMLGTYCYSHRIIYIDKETWVAVLNEMYDPDGKFWKVRWIEYAPIHYDDSEVMIHPASQVSGVMADFKDNHASIDVFRDMTIDEKVPKQYQKSEELAFPSGLQQILQ
jgi:Protein of unknown function (DUF1329)